MALLDAYTYFRLDVGVHQPVGNEWLTVPRGRGGIEEKEPENGGPPGFRATFLCSEQEAAFVMAELRDTAAGLLATLERRRTRIVRADQPDLFFEAAVRPIEPTREIRRALAQSPASFATRAALTGRRGEFGFEACFRSSHAQAAVLSGHLAYVAQLLCQAHAAGLIEDRYPTGLTFGDLMVLLRGVVAGEINAEHAELATAITHDEAASRSGGPE
jgi:hypothetical protein